MSVAGPETESAGPADFRNEDSGNCCANLTAAQVNPASWMESPQPTECKCPDRYRDPLSSFSFYRPKSFCVKKKILETQGEFQRLTKIAARTMSSCPLTRVSGSSCCQLLAGDQLSGGQGVVRVQAASTRSLLPPLEGCDFGLIIPVSWCAVGPSCLAV